MAKTKQELFPIYYPELSSNSQKSTTLSKNKRLGEYKQGKVIYSFYEVFYLVENKKAAVLKNNKTIKLDELLKIFQKKQKEFLTNYIVFKDLRKKGYIKNPINMQPTWFSPFNNHQNLI